MIILFGDKILYKNNSINTVKVGIIASADSSFSQMAYSMVEEMDSYKQACEFVYLTSEEQGITMLNNEEIKALVMVPDNIIKSIISGENNPIQVIYNQDGSLDTYTLSSIFESTASMLATAQAATCTIYGMAYKLDLSSQALDYINDDINQMYFTYVLSRMDMFINKELNATGSYSTTSFYLTSGILLLLSLTGIIFISFVKGNNNSYLTKLKIAGINKFQLALSQFIAIAVSIYILYVLIYILCIVLGLFVEGIDITPSLQGLIYIIPAIIVITLVIIISAYLPANYAGSCMILFIFILCAAYVGGGIVPEKLLPPFVAKYTTWSPFYYMLKLTARGLF
jgi:hypothetical protein